MFLKYSLIIKVMIELRLCLSARVRSKNIRGVKITFRNASHDTDEIRFKL